MIRSILTNGIFATALLATALPAAAFPGHGPRACAADREAFCPDAHGPREVGACLREHEAELSADCLAEYERREACRAEVEVLCADVEGPDLHDCVMMHRDELSEGCRRPHRHEPPSDSPG